jgi:four helix bundle protein
MSEQGDVLKERTIQFAVSVLGLVDKLPKTSSGYAIGNQLARRGTGIGANYRSVRTARSRAEFIAKLGVVVEEADETTFWLELVMRLKIAPMELSRALHAEACELRAIFAKSVGTARANQRATRLG